MLRRFQLHKEPSELCACFHLLDRYSRASNSHRHKRRSRQSLRSSYPLILVEHNRKTATVLPIYKYSTDISANPAFLHFYVELNRVLCNKKGRSGGRNSTSSQMRELKVTRSGVGAKPNRVECVNKLLTLFSTIKVTEIGLNCGDF